MPFKSKAQLAKCQLLKKQGKNGTWDCSKMAKETPNLKSLPKRAKPKAKLKAKR
jgi:hypothetical protein